MNSDCLVFDTNIAQLFADNGNLGINVTISMCWPPEAATSPAHDPATSLHLVAASAAQDSTGMLDHRPPRSKLDWANMLWVWVKTVWTCFILSM